MEPTSMGPSAMRKRLKYVTTIPSVVAASLPVKLDRLEAFSPRVSFNSNSVDMFSLETQVRRVPLLCG